MTFQPFVPMGGLTGWRFLQSTLETQRSAHAEGAAQKRDLAYFRENIGEVTSAADLVSDRRLLSVALGAFGLDDDIDARFLIRRVLEEGTDDPEALANRLSDKRYRDMSRAFGFDDPLISANTLPGFADRIEARFRDRRFETDMGQTNETMRLALNAQRELATLAEGEASNRTKWFTIMGTPPLREVMEATLNMPSAMATLSIDRQLEEFMERARAVFGTDEISELGQPDRLAPLLDRFTALSGIADSAGGNVTSPALVLLRGF